MLYHEALSPIQSDGDCAKSWMGWVWNVNQEGTSPELTICREAEERAFISGASVVASRHFIETVGLMRKDYFLYFQDVEWITRHGPLPLALYEEAFVHHRGGTAMRAGSVTCRTSPFALYFNFCSRVRFLAHVWSLSLPVSCAAALVRIMKLAAQRAWSESWAALLSLCELPPPKALWSMLFKDVAEYAFDRRWNRHA